ncbi:MAG: hypothetical protein ABJP48_01355 [Erythrobacter sp.]
MKQIAGAIASMCLLTSCADKTPTSVYKHCVSASGESEYFIAIDVAGSDGSLRYRYFGQDVLYRINDLQIRNTEIKGVAPFANSATGEVRGTPVEFSYDWSKESFYDAFVEFECSQLQDRELAELPEIGGASTE